MMNTLITEIRNQTSFEKIDIKKYANSLQFIHYHDFTLFNHFVEYLDAINSNFIQNYSFEKLNDLNKPYIVDVQDFNEHYSGVLYNTRIVKLNQIKSTNKNVDIIVSQPNINIDEKEFLKRLGKPSFDETAKFMKILILAKETNTNLLILPEGYVYLEWLETLASFSKKESMDIIFGCAPIIYHNKFFNFISSFHSFTSNSGFKYCYPIIREKNDYSYKEKQLCEGKYTIHDKKIPLYINVHKKNYSIAPYLCFEITDITARSLFRGKTDIIAIPMLNQDTTYFNNIIHSLSRDLSCIVITSNSSIVGNSTISLPKETHSRILTEFIGD